MLRSSSHQDIDDDFQAFKASFYATDDMLFVNEDGFFSEENPLESNASEMSQVEANLLAKSSFNNEISFNNNHDAVIEFSDDDMQNDIQLIEIDDLLSKTTQTNSVALAASQDTHVKNNKRVHEEDDYLAGNATKKAKVDELANNEYIASLLKQIVLLEGENKVLRGWVDELQTSSSQERIDALLMAQYSEIKEENTVLLRQAAILGEAVKVVLDKNTQAEQKNSSLADDLREANLSIDSLRKQLSAAQEDARIAYAKSRISTAEKSNNQDRMNYLESQNKNLQNQVDSLQSKVTRFESKVNSKPVMPGFFSPVSVNNHQAMTAEKSLEAPPTIASTFERL